MQASLAAAAPVSEAEPVEPLEMPAIGTWLQAEDRGHWYDARVVKTRDDPLSVFVFWHGFKKSAQRWVPLLHSRIRLPKQRSPSPKQQASPPPSQQQQHTPDAPPPPSVMPEEPEEEDEEAAPIDPEEVTIGAHVRVKHNGAWYNLAESS